MKISKKIIAVLFVCLLAVPFCGCSTNEEGGSPVPTVSTAPAASKKSDPNENMYDYAVGEFNEQETAEISAALVAEYGDVYKGEGTGSDGFKKHYIPQGTVRYNGVRYNIVVVKMDVTDFETGGIAYVSTVDAFAVSDDFSEIYQAEPPSEGKVYVNFSKNLLAK